MPVAFSEIRIERDGRDVPSMPPTVQQFDKFDPDTTTDLLRRHLLAALDRAHIPRRDAHLYVVAVYDSHDGRGYGRPVFRWALPVEAGE